MSSLIPSITISEFKKLHAFEIKELKSVEVMSDGEHLFTAIIPKGDYIGKDHIRTQAEYLAQKSNVTQGKDLEEINARVPVSVS